MSGRYWLFIIAVGGFLAARASADDTGSLKDDPTKLAKRDNRTATRALPDTQLPTPPADNTSGFYFPQDTQANYYDREGLFAQQRMAEANDEIVSLTYWQIAVGFVETILLLATIFLSLKATRAASRAAVAAETTIDHARSQSVAELRAYLAIEKIYLSEFNDTQPPDFVTVIKNHGSTPAFNVTHRTQRMPFKKDETEFSLSDSRKTKVVDIAPGQTVYQIGHYQVEQWILSGGAKTINIADHDIYCFGIITYEDIFHIEHTTEYRFWLPFYVDGKEETEFLPHEGGNYLDRHQSPASSKSS